MSRIIDEPILVHVNKNSILTAFIWRHRLYKVKNLLTWWREPQNWWAGEHPVRLLLRVTATGNATGIYELCKKGQDWFLYRLLD